MAMGVGQLLFEVCKGVQKQFHSCTEKVNQLHVCMFVCVCVSLSAQNNEYTCTYTCTCTCTCIWYYTWQGCGFYHSVVHVV